MMTARRMRVGGSHTPPVTLDRLTFTAATGHQTDASLTIGVAFNVTHPGALCVAVDVLVPVDTMGAVVPRVGLYDYDTHALLGSSAPAALAPGLQTVNLTVPVAMNPVTNYLAVALVGAYSFQGTYPWPASSPLGWLITGLSASRFDYGPALQYPANVTDTNFYVSPVVQLP